MKTGRFLVIAALTIALVGIMALGAGTPAWAQDGTTTDPDDNICGRTQPVLKALLEVLDGTDCGNYTQEDLEGITGELTFNLTTLDGDGNTVNHVLTQADLEGLINLTTLTFPNLTNTLERDVFQGLNSIYNINLSGGRLQTLHQDTFQDVDTLKTLDLSNNAVNSLPKGLFRDLTSLNTLDLSGNAWTVLPRGVFQNLTALKDLDLNSNTKLTELPEGIFNNLTAMESLSLKENGLDQLGPRIFSTMTELQSLDVSKNQLAELPDLAFEELENLTDVDYSDNPGGPFNIQAEVQVRSVDHVTSTLRVRILQGAAFETTVNLAATTGTLSKTSVKIAAGDNASEDFTLTRATGEKTSAVTATPDAWPTPDEGLDKSISGVKVEGAPEITVTFNSLATGAPSITGDATVGSTLSADTSGISDADGIEDVSWSYQWHADGVAITGATGSTYVVATADQGKAISVQVSFTDAAGFQESLNSEETSTVPVGGL